MKNDKQPEIRLPGFTEDWEQRKFGEIINERREKTKIENEDILLSSAIDGMYLNSELFSHFRGISNIGYLKIRKNDMILSAQNLHLGNCNINKRFDHGIISPAYKVYSLVDVDVDFIHAWIKKDSTKKFFEKATTEGASVCRKNIEWGTLYNQKMYIPIYSEQQKIGVFFKQMDDTITLHQQELETLKQTKQGFLQKMFPKEGESVPEIRFPAYTGEWKNHTLGETADSMAYGLNASSKKYDGENKYIRITDIDDSTHKFLKEKITSPNTDLSLAEEYLLNEGDILFARTGASVGKTYIYDSKDGKVYYAGFLIRARIKNEYIPEFIFQNTLTSRYRKFIKVASQRSGQPGVNAQEYAGFSFMIPNKKEQQEISEFFKQLDEVIALHQQELDALKQTKKAFLQKMFV